MKYIERKYEKLLGEYLSYSPVVGIVGPRQCGKSTLVQNLKNHNIEYIDLENREDQYQIQNPFLFFRANQNKVICLDEIQFAPEIFVDIKSFIDREKENVSFIILGSASPELLRQSSESMAGRIIFIEMSNFLWLEIKNFIDFNKYFLFGGYPKAILPENETQSKIWLKNYTQTFFLKDILQLSPGIEAQQTKRLFHMLAHTHGQELNIHHLSKSLGISFATVKSYIDILLGAFQLILLPAYYKNTKKRLIKSPKLYISDHGILHSLLNITSFNQLLGHPIFGFSFEGLVIKNIMHHINDAEFSFYKTSNGAEIDLIVELPFKTIAIEIKSSSTPKVTRGFWNAIEDINADEAWVIAQIEKTSYLKENVTICNLTYFLENINHIEQL